MNFVTRTSILIVIAVISLENLVLAFPKIAASDLGGLRLTKRLIGGQNARPWPWHAGIRVWKKADKKFNLKCGGSLINEEWVVTAASCVVEYPLKDNYQVILGDNDRSKTEGTEQLFNVSDVRLHYNFSTEVDLGNDVALLKLSRKITNTTAVQPISLPKQGKRIAVGKKCYFTGWGMTYPGSNLSNVLQEAMVPIVDHSVCKEGLKHMRPVDERSMICAGYGSKSNISGCGFDGGGPLSCKEDGKYVLRGAVTWGDGKCRTSGDQHSVFARISTYVDWIHQQMTTPAPKLPECEDNHWYCNEWYKNDYCIGKDKWYTNVLYQYCPITCNNPKCKDYCIGNKHRN